MREQIRLARFARRSGHVRGTAARELTVFFSANGHAQSDNELANKVLRFGKQPVSLGVHGGSFAVSPPGGPEWRLRLFATFLFPTG
jgi:hypothetical protein